MSALITKNIASFAHSSMEVGGLCRSRVESPDCSYPKSAGSIYWMSIESSKKEHKSDMLMELIMGTIYITSKDLNRLRTLLRDAMEKNQDSKKNLSLLHDELNQSEVCEQKDIPKDVITMNSRIRLRDLDSNEDLIYTLVYPAHANAELGRISVLAPIGTAVIGYGVGDVIEWPVPGGVRRLQVKEVLFQPEAAGDFLS